MFFECPSGVNLKCSTECFPIRKGFLFRNIRTFNYPANLKEPLENHFPPNSVLCSALCMHFQFQTEHGRESGNSEMLTDTQPE